MKRFLFLILSIFFINNINAQEFREVYKLTSNISFWASNENIIYLVSYNSSGYVAIEVGKKCNDIFKNLLELYQHIQLQSNGIVKGPDDQYYYVEPFRDLEGLKCWKIRYSPRTKNTIIFTEIDILRAIRHTELIDK